MKEEVSPDLVLRVRELFNGDQDKTVNWFSLPNPAFGNISPIDMIKADRIVKLNNL